MAPRNSPTVWRRWLAAELKALREAKGLHQKDVGRECGWSGARLSYLEHGQQVPTEDDLDQLLPLYGVDPESAPKFYEAVKFAREKGWWERHADVPEFLRDFIGFEQGARLIRVVEPCVVPGLLQTRDYSVANLRQEVMPRAEPQIGRIADLRLRRQRVLSGDAPADLDAIIDESVLHRVVGTFAVMAAQLGHLVEMSQRPNVTLRVLPFERGTHSAMYSSFRIVAFEDQPPVLYLEHSEGAAYHQETAKIDHHLILFNDVADRALPAGPSTALLQEMIASYATRSRKLEEG